MGLIDVIRRTVKRELKNIEELTVNIIRPGKERQDLLLENGSGASVKLSGDSVYINGIDSGDLGASSGGTPSITDVMAGTGIWGEPAPKDFPFAYAGWGKYVAMYLPESVGVPSFGLYVHQLNAADCAFISSDKILPAGTFVRRTIDNDYEPKVYSGSDYNLTTEYDKGAAYYLSVIEVGENDTAWIKLFRDGAEVSSQYLNSGDNFVYERTVDGVTFPIVVARVKQVFSGQETTAVEFGGVWKVDDAWVENVDYNSAGVYLYEPNNVDLQRKRLQFGNQSYIEDSVDDSGNLRVSGDINVKIGTSSGDVFTEGLRVSNDKIDPKVPIDMGTLSITTSKDTFATNELVDKEYVDALVNTSQYWTTLSGMARMLSAKPLDMAGYAITGLPTQSGTLDPNDAATIGYVNDNVGGGVTVHNDLTGRDVTGCHPTGAITGLDAVIPTTDEKAALAGTGVPSSANKYVTADGLDAYLALNGDSIMAGSIKLSSGDNYLSGTADTGYVILNSKNETFLTINGATQMAASSSGTEFSNTVTVSNLDITGSVTGIGTEAATANTIPLRDASGDLHVNDKLYFDTVSGAFMMKYGQTLYYYPGAGIDPVLLITSGGGAIDGTLSFSDSVTMKSGSLNIFEMRASYAFVFYAENQVVCSLGAVDGLTMYKGISMGGNAITNALMKSGGNVILGLDNTFPYFPVGLVLGASATGSETITSNVGRMVFDALNGFDFTMPVNMGGNAITGLPATDPINDSDAATKKYVDAQVPSNCLLLDGSKTMTGDLNMGGENIDDASLITATGIRVGSASFAHSSLGETGTYALWNADGASMSGLKIAISGTERLTVESESVSINTGLHTGEISISNTEGTHSATISVNTNGDLVFHVAAGKGIIFEEG